MLQFALQPLLLYVDPIADQPGDVLLLKLNASCLSAFHPDLSDHTLIMCDHACLLSVPPLTVSNDLTNMHVNKAATPAI